MKNDTLVLSKPHPTSLLSRRDVGDPKEIEEIIATESVVYASDNLGYKHPKKLAAIRKSQLSEALRIGGIRPFDHRTVRDYQVHCLNEKHGRDGFIRRFAAEIGTDHNGERTGLDTTLAILSGFLLIVGLGFLIGSIVTESSLRWPIAVTFIGGILLPFALKVKILAKNWQWERSMFRSYAGEIPAFALATAREIHMRAPKTIFYVEELIEVETRRVVDPFLIAQSGEDDGAEYYVEVWDEPRFDQTRRV